MAESRLLKTFNNFQLRLLGDELVTWFRSEKHLTAEGMAAQEGYLVQAKSVEGWKKWVGMDQALQVQLSLAGENLLVTVGAAQWVDKAAAGTAGMLVFAPLAVTAAVGAWMQGKLPAEVFRFCEDYIRSEGKGSVRINLLATDGNDIRCSSCGALNTKGTKFCQQCGQRIGQECAQCHAALQLGAKFCPECGTAVAPPATGMGQCPKCGVEMPSASKFCPECGHQIANPLIS